MTRAKDIRRAQYLYLRFLTQYLSTPFEKLDERHRDFTQVSPLKVSAIRRLQRTLSSYFDAPIMNDARAAAMTVDELLLAYVEPEQRPRLPSPPSTQSSHDID